MEGRVVRTWRMPLIRCYNQFPASSALEAAQYLHQDSLTQFTTIVIINLGLLKSNVLIIYIIKYFLLSSQGVVFQLADYTSEASRRL